MLLFFFSGFTSLSFQTLWNKILGQTVGTDYYSVTIIVSIFMIGLGLGAELGALITRYFFRPIIVFIIFEIVISIFGFFSPQLLRLAPIVSSMLSSIFYTPDLVSDFLVNFVLLIIPVMLMGASLPIIVYEMRRYFAPGRLVGYLYSINILGAVCGVLISGLYLIGVFGITTTTQISSFLNLILATVGLLVLLKFNKIQGKENNPTCQSIAGKWLIFSFSIGFVMLALEMFYFRVLIYFFGATSYVFPIALSSFLFLMFFGNLTAGILLRHQQTWQKTLTVACIGGLLSLLLIFIAPIVFYSYKLSSIINFGYGMSALTLILGFLFSIIVMLPIFFVSMIFPITISAITERVNAVGDIVGRLYFIQTFGNFFGALVTGFIFLPFIGTLGTVRLLALMIFGAFLFLIIDWSKPKQYLNKTIIRPTMLMGITLAIVLSGINDSFFKSFGSPPPTRVSEELEGTAFLYDYPQRTRIQIGAEPATSYYTETVSMPVWPMDVALTLLNREPKRILVIGIGTANQVLALRAIYPNVQVDVVELLDVVIREMKERGNKELKAGLIDLNIFITDGRRFVNKLQPQGQYDIVQIGVFHVASAGAGNLFTREFLERIKAITADDGIVTFNAYVPVVADAIDRFRGILIASRGDDQVADVFLLKNKPIDINLLDFYYATRKVLDSKLLTSEKQEIYLTSNPPGAFFIFSKPKIAQLLQGIRGQTDDFLITEYFLNNKSVLPGTYDPRIWPAKSADVFLNKSR